jgi:hypothetical protein
MKYQGFLQFYKICLQLYPAKFRGRYAEQMYLTAADMLQDGYGMPAIGRLLGDTCVGIITEYTKQLGENRMKKQRKVTTTMGDRAWLGVQIVAMLLMAWVSAQPFINIPAVIRQQPPIYSIDSLLMGLLPLALTGVAFWLLGGLRLRRWTRAFSSFAIGCASAGAFYWFGSIAAMRLWWFLPWRTSFGTLHMAYDIATLFVYLSLFYLVGRRLMARLAIKPAARSAS